MDSSDDLLKVYQAQNTRAKKSDDSTTKREEHHKLFKVYGDHFHGVCKQLYELLTNGNHLENRCEL